MFLYWAECPIQNIPPVRNARKYTENLGAKEANN